VDTPDIGVYSYPIPTCITPEYWPYTVRGAPDVAERAGPSTKDPLVHVLVGGSTIDVVCRTSGPIVGTSGTWDYLLGHSYIPDYYVGGTNGTRTARTQQVPRCPTIEPAGAMPAPKLAPTPKRRSAPTAASLSLKASDVGVWREGPACSSRDDECRIRTDGTGDGLSIIRQQQINQGRQDETNRAGGRQGCENKGATRPAVSKLRRPGLLASAGPMGAVVPRDDAGRDQVRGRNVHRSIL